MQVGAFVESIREDSHGEESKKGFDILHAFFDHVSFCIMEVLESEEVMVFIIYIYSLSKRPLDSAKGGPCKVDSVAVM